ncbi:MAG: hypothetical protein AB9836_05250 [Aminipila sp.]
MLSNKDIIRELGKNLCLYPLFKEKIKGASINLTASSMAWSINTKNSIIEDNVIKIKAHDTVLLRPKKLLALLKS